MTKAQQARVTRLLPDGRPRWVRIYDNGGPDAVDGSIDRYTVVYTGRYRCCADKTCRAHSQYVGMSGSPYHPQGMCMHGESPQPIDSLSGQWPPAIGRRNHLGKRIRFEELPADCQRVVISDYRELWGIPVLDWRIGQAGAIWTAGDYCITTYRQIALGISAGGYVLLHSREELGRYETLAKAQDAAENHNRGVWPMYDQAEVGA